MRFDATSAARCGATPAPSRSCWAKDCSAWCSTTKNGSAMLGREMLADGQQELLFLVRERPFGSFGDAVGAFGPAGPHHGNDDGPFEPRQLCAGADVAARVRLDIAGGNRQ